MSDTTREAFEASQRSEVLALIRRKDNGFFYTSSRTQWVWEIWQAATQAERERCAKEATELAEDAAIKYANGHPVNFGNVIGNVIRMPPKGTEQS